MAYNTVIQQGRFTADGNAKTIAIRSDWDWMWVYNLSVITAAGAGAGAQFYFQRGMTDGTGVIYTKTAGTQALAVGALAANNGFFYVDSSVYSTGANTALTAITDANPPVVTSVGHGLVVNDVVQFNNLDNQRQIAGIPFTVTAVPTADTFTIGNISMANSTASTSGS